jgi:putative intracellular protease/amidase
MRILMILVPDQNATAQHLPLVQFVEPYYEFRDAGVEVVLVSPEGGAAFDRLSSADGVPKELVDRFYADKVVRETVADTLPISQAFSEDFEAAFCIGVMGAIPAEASEPSAASLIARFLASGKPVVAVPNMTDLPPLATGAGLLISSTASGSLGNAARALLAALGTKRR